MAEKSLTLEEMVGPVRFTIARALADCTSSPMKAAPVWWGKEAKAVVEYLEAAGYVIVKQPSDAQDSTQVTP